MRKKKLQVFVSSTFTDLIEERQAAVQAILSCGHIPAGMELFTAGDESQMEVIKQWIEDSDVYLLILGGRYGSIETKSGKSYTHLEYDYAVSLEKPLFAVVITEDALDKKVNQVDKSVLELKNPQKLEEFKSVVLSKMVKFFDDIKDIKLAIHETMSKFERKELIGWIRGDQEVDTDNLAEQMAQLTKENMNLRERLVSFSNVETYGGLSFEEFINVLKKHELEADSERIEDYFTEEKLILFKEIKNKFKDKEYNLLHYFWAYATNEIKGSFYIYDIEKYGLVEDILRHLPSPTNFEPREYKYELTALGKKLYTKLIATYSIE